MRIPPLLPSALAALLACFHAEIGGAQARNLDFSQADPAEPTRPAFWSLGGEGYEISLDTIAYVGDWSLRMRRVESGGFAVATQALDPGAVPEPGARVKLTGRIRTDGVSEGYAGLWLRVDGPERQILYLDNMSGRGATGTSDWMPYAVEVAVPAGAAHIAFGALLPGSGTAWFDDLRFEVEERAVTLEAPRALTDSGLENLAAFSRLLGYVRYFHPSDQAAGADWNRIAVEGVRVVEGAGGPVRLAAVLDSIFRPLAPTLSIRTGGQGAHASASPLPDGATEVVTWRHFGVAGETLGPYRSDRLRTSLAAGTLPDSIADPEEPLELDLASGVHATLPLALYADAEGTLPRGEPPVPELSLPGAYTADDRATRLGAVTLAWNVFEHFYPYFDVVGADWDAELTRALGAAAEDADRCAFVETLERLVAGLHDGHGRVTGSCTASSSHLPVAVDWVEDRLMVTHIAADPSLLRRGDALLRIDGRPVEEIVRERDALISAAAPGWARARMLQTLLGGAPGSPVELTVERPTGEIVTLTEVRRRQAGPVREPRPLVVAELEQGIWYVDLDRVTTEQFRAALPNLTAADGIVFDLRGYPTQAAVEILTHLIDQPRTSPQWHIPVVTHPGRVGMRFFHAPGWDLRPSEPILPPARAIITDGRAISFAESVMGIIEAYDLATIVGQPTAATNGNINQFTLPGGSTVVWTGMKVLKHDGTTHHGVGIHPHVPVERTRAGVVEGRDEMLERAVETVRGR